METKENKSSSLVTIVLVVLVALLGGYIGYDKLVNNTNNTKCDTKTVEKVVDLINNGNRMGTYSIYMGSNSDSEYTLTMYYTEDKDNGFFTITEATTMSYNTLTGGYYSIKDSNIEFYNNLENETAKNEFVNAFSMQVSDLYQDSKAVSEESTKEYRLKLKYENGKISNSKITFEKLY